MAKKAAKGKPAARAPANASIEIDLQSYKSTRDQVSP